MHTDIDTLLIRSFVALSVKIVWCYIAGWRSVSQSVTSQKWLTVAIWLSWMTFRNDCLKWLSWWLSRMTVMNFTYWSVMDRQMDRRTDGHTHNFHLVKNSAIFWPIYLLLELTCLLLAFIGNKLNFGLPLEDCHIF